MYKQPLQDLRFKSFWFDLILKTHLYWPFVEEENWSESGDGCAELPHTCADSAREPSRERAVLQGETPAKSLNINELNVFSFASFCEVFFLIPAHTYTGLTSLIFKYLSIFQEELDSQYGPQYDCALEKLLWEFLTRLDQLLPVPDLAQVRSFWVGFFFIMNLHLMLYYLHNYVIILAQHYI